jgi:hypothetical protein
MFSVLGSSPYDMSRSRSNRSSLITAPASRMIAIA